MELHIFIRKNKQECEGNQKRIRKKIDYFWGGQNSIYQEYIYADIFSGCQQKRMKVKKKRI